MSHDEAGASLHHGIEGLLDTTKALDEVGITYTGIGKNDTEARKDLIIEKDGKKIAVASSKPIHFVEEISKYHDIYKYYDFVSAEDFKNNHSSKKELIERCLEFFGNPSKDEVLMVGDRFYDIDDGKIRYDGININKIRKSDLRRSLGIVLQDVNLFTGTVMDNIRYGKLDASDEECIEAAKLANAHDFITRLPEGYNTMLSANGANLSQGQRQLLSIARAAVANPPVLILDEATSSIDTRTERLIEKGMDKLMEGRTVFVIAHRLSTVRNSNAIMVLENGEIIERGDHDDLIAQQGKYYQLYTGQFELD